MASGVQDIDRGYKKIVKELGKVKNAPYVKIGVLSSAGEYEKGGHASLADVATWNEFGTTRSPSRPFMAQTFDENQEETKAFIEKEQGRVLDGKQTEAQALARIGVFYEGKTKQTFVKGEFAPNAPYTIERKGSSRPLIDTGRLLRQSITHEVRMDGGE